MSLYRCFKDFMADPSNAAAGTQTPAEAQRSNPEEYTAAHDRNLLLIAAFLFKESYEKETGGTWDLDPTQLWREQCEETAGFRDPVPTWMWRNDPKVYGNVVRNDALPFPSVSLVLTPLYVCRIRSATSSKPKISRPCFNRARCDSSATRARRTTPPDPTQIGSPRM